MPSSLHAPFTDPAPQGLGAAIKFNPQLWKPDELRAIFVARQPELQELVQRLRDAQPEVPPQHVLITGHRGMGKSTLLHRLALAVEDDAELSQQWVPLLFREEQYTAVTLDKFWRNALDALSEALERRSATNPQWDSDIQALDNLNARLDQVNDASAREAQVLATLHDWATRHRCRLLLLVDSTEQLFEGLSHAKSSGPQTLWSLRNTLSTDPLFFWVGCAYTALEAHQDYDSPFHEFFAQLPLKPLTVDDMRSAFLALARTFGAGRGLPPAQAETHIQTLLTRQPERLETLLRLAGGNPRTTVMLYQLLSAGGHDNVHTDLQRLLDDMSPLYKDRLEHQLAVQPRQIVATLMEGWAPMSANAIAQATAMPVTQINAQLTRLEKDGWIEKVRLPDTKRSGYQVAERFFNVWYLMRFAPRRLRLRLTWLVEFMRAWFSQDELNGLAQRRIQGHLQRQWSDERQMEYSRALSLSLNEDCAERAQLELTLFMQTQRGKIGDIVLFDVDDEDRVYASLEDEQTRFQNMRHRLENDKAVYIELGVKESEWAELVLGSFFLSLDNKEIIAKAMPTLSQFKVDGLIKVFKEVAEKFEQLFDTSQEYRRLSECLAQGKIFLETKDPGLSVIQVNAWLRDCPQAFNFCIQKIINIHKDNPSALEVAMGEAFFKSIKSPNQLVKIGNNLIGANVYKSAEYAYRQAIALDPKYAYPWNGLGNLLQDHLQRYDEAEAAYRQAMSLDQKHPYPIANLARLQVQLGQRDAAATSYTQVLDLVADSVSRAHLRLQSHLYLGQTEAAAQALDDMTRPLEEQPEDARTLFLLEEQMYECHQIGCGLALADLLAQSPHAPRLLPLELALRHANGQAERLWSEPAEVQALAREIAQQLDTAHSPGA